MLKAGTAVDATAIAARSPTKNKGDKRDPEMHQNKKGGQCTADKKAHIGVDANSGLIHPLTTTAANVDDVTEPHKLRHGEEAGVFGDLGYREAEKRAEVIREHPGVAWHITMVPGKHRRLGTSREVDAPERLKAGIRSKVEHPFQVLKRQFGCTEVKYRWLAKNTANLQTIFALVNLWIARKRILQGIQA